MNIFSFTKEAGSKYGLRIAINSNQLQSAKLIAQNVSGEEVKDFLSQSWDISCLASEVHELAIAAKKEKDPIRFVEKHYPGYVYDAIQEILQNQEQRKRKHLQMPAFSEKDAEHFENLSLNQDFETVLMSAVIQACNPDGSIDIYLFTHILVDALNTILEHA